VELIQAVNSDLRVVTLELLKVVFEPREITPIWEVELDGEVVMISPSRAGFAMNGGETGDNVVTHYRGLSALRVLSGSYSTPTNEVFLSEVHWVRDHTGDQTLIPMGAAAVEGGTRSEGRGDIVVQTWYIYTYCMYMFVVF
jgi:hypothetical protein